MSSVGTRSVAKWAVRGCVIGRAKGPPPAQPCISGAMRNCGMGCGCMAAALVRVRVWVRARVRVGARVRFGSR